MRILVLLIFFILPFFAFGQECNCESDFKWVKRTFEENDAGYQYSIRSKGKSTYEKHNTDLKSRVTNVTSRVECNRLLKEWLSFFRSGHIVIRNVNNANGQIADNEISNDAIRQKYSGSEKITIDIEEFRKYLKAKESIDFEGIWSIGPYTIGVKRIEDTYKGFVIEADGIYWMKGQVKFEIYSDDSAVFRMKDHSERNFERTILLGDNHIIADYIKLNRVFPVLDRNEEIEKYVEVISANKPYFEYMDSSTTYLRIPTFRGSEKNSIDSVILSNKDKILSTPNLIIDIRNNGGGADRSYSELVPILYTNPIRSVGVEYFSSILNNQRMLDFINIEEYGFDDQEKSWAKESYHRLSKRIGEFVNLDTAIVEILKCDTIYSYPKNIGILINENNGSTAEQFLLDAKQSKKVKLYGTTTSGVLDISNLNFVPSPCNEFELGYSLSKSMRIPDMSIDDKGIQPDYYLDRSIPKYKWIEYVVNSLIGSR